MSGLIRGAEPEAKREVVEVAVAEPDLGRTFDNWRILEEQFVYFPPDRKEGETFPVVVLLQDKNTAWRHFARATGWKDLADEQRIILVGTSDNGRWRSEDLEKGRPQSAVDLILPKLRKALADLPLQPDRVFIVTHGTGGRVAGPMSLEPWARGLVMHTFNRGPGEKDMSGPPIPALLIAPTDSPFWPLGPGGCQKFEDISRFERAWKQRNKARGEGRVEELEPLYPRGTAPVCTHWDGEEPFISCRVPGGSQWPGLGTYNEDDCLFRPETEAEFPSTKYAWEFLERIGQDADRGQ